MATDATQLDIFGRAAPPVDEAMHTGTAEPYIAEAQEYKIKRLPVDSSGTWIKKTKNWRPQEVSTEMWQQNPAMHETWRKMFPDTRKMKADAQPTEATTSAAIANAEDGIEDGDISAEPRGHHRQPRRKSE